MILFEWDGRRVYGHDGGTIGQSSRLRIVPDARPGDQPWSPTAGRGRSRCTRSCSASWSPSSPASPCPGHCRRRPSRRTSTSTRFAGSYQRLSVRYDLTPEDGRLVGTVTLSGPIAAITPDPVTKVTLMPVDDETFLVQDEESETPTPAVFYEFHDGVPQYLHHGARANPRVADLTRRSSAGTTNDVRIWVRPRFGGSLTDHTVGAAPG